MTNILILANYCSIIGLPLGAEVAREVVPVVVFEFEFDCSENTITQGMMIDNIIIDKTVKPDHTFRFVLEIKYFESSFKIMSLAPLYIF